MKIVIQRVSQAKVEVDQAIVGSINKGVVVLVGVTHNDTLENIRWLVNKLVNLRIFEDKEGKINHSLLDIHGEILVISQFTLYADCSTGRRPSFTQAARPEIAESLYQSFVEEVRKAGLHVETGIFGALMQLSLVNDGPFTLTLENANN